MEYLSLLQEWLEHSRLYQEFLIHLPAPLNNIYFDLLAFFILCIWFLQWIFGSIAMIRRRKKIRKRRNDLQKAQEQAELEAVFREREMRQKQEQLDRQMKLLQMYLMFQYMPKKQYQQNENYRQIEEILRNRLTAANHNKVTNMSTSAIEQQNIYYLPEFEATEPSQNEFERLMAILGADESIKEELLSRQLAQEQMAEKNQQELDRKLKTDISWNEAEIQENVIDSERQRELERRKAMAVKLALKEQKRAERKKRGIFK